MFKRSYESLFANSYGKTFNHFFSGFFNRLFNGFFNDFSNGFFNGLIRLSALKSRKITTRLRYVYELSPQVKTSLFSHNNYGFLHLSPIFLLEGVSEDQTRT